MRNLLAVVIGGTKWRTENGEGRGKGRNCSAWWVKKRGKGDLSQRDEK